MEFLRTRNYYAAVVRLELLIKETTCVAKHQRQQERTHDPYSGGFVPAKNIFPELHYNQPVRGLSAKGAKCNSLGPSAQVKPVKPS
jgi:hypothetical protein